MDTAQWPQEIVVKPIEDIVTNTCPKPAAVVERKARSQKEQVLNCPRCNSSNTKFCYYNNYSLTQPRYFCKACRRYWTEGGSLRNIPVGGGSRKNKRSSSSYSSSSQAHSKKLPDLVNPQNNPKKINQAQDLNLSFQSNNQDFNTNLSDLVSNSNNPTIAAAAATSQQISALELLTGMTNSKGLNSFIPNIPVLDHHHYSSLVYTSGFPLHHDQFKPSLNFSLDGALGINGFGNLQGVPDHETSNGRILLPFEDLKQGAAASASASASASTANGMEQSKEQGDSTGFWTGMLSGGSW